MSRGDSGRDLRGAGVAGVAGGLGWTARVALTFSADAGASVLGYGALDALVPLALALAVVGVAGHYVRTQASWGRATTAGFVAFFAGLLGALAGSTAYVAAGALVGWTISVWSYFLALAGAVGFGAGLLWDEVPPRSGAALLTLALPAGLVASLSLAVGGVVPDEAVVPVGPGVLLGAGVAALGWWVWREEEADYILNS